MLLAELDHVVVQFLYFGDRDCIVEAGANATNASEKTKAILKGNVFVAFLPMSFQRDHVTLCCALEEFLLEHFVASLPANTERHIHTRAVARINWASVI